MLQKTVSDLPLDILLGVMLLLGYTDLLACSLVNKVFNGLIRSSASLQLLIASGIAGSVPRFGIELPSTLHERITSLHSRETAWNSLSVSQISHLLLPPHTFHLFECAGGYLFVGITAPTEVDVDYNEPHTIAYAALPTCPSTTAHDPIITWHQIDFKEAIIETAANVQEHDLVVVITRGYIYIDSIITQQYFIAHFISISSTTPHPAASKADLRLCEAHPNDSPVTITSEVIGIFLAVLVVTSSVDDDDYDDRFFLWNWKTGCLIHSHTAPWGTYSGLAFLAHDMIMLFNKTQFSLECYHIPYSSYTPTPLVQKCLLVLPQLTANAFVHLASCASEPPLVSSYAKTFTESNPSCPEDALVTFTFLLHNPEPHPHDMQFVLVMHRRALLELLPPVDKYPTSYIHTLAWSTWGQYRCRWFCSDLAPVEWKNISYGQRLVMNIFGCISVWDFNPAVIRRLAWASEQRNIHAEAYTNDPDQAVTDTESNHSTGSQSTPEDMLYSPGNSISGLYQDGTEHGSDPFIRPHVLNGPGAMFIESVITGLPFHRVASRNLPDYQSIFIYEGTLLGLVENNVTGQLTAIDVLHLT